MHYKRENAHDQNIWTVAWGHRERAEEVIPIEPEEKESGEENKENEAVEASTDQENVAGILEPNWTD